MFDGSHVAYLTYEADDLIARGTLTSTRAVIQEATATAYGANVRLTPSFIGIDAPYTFSFVGRADGVDQILSTADKEPSIKTVAKRPSVTDEPVSAEAAAYFFQISSIE